MTASEQHEPEQPTGQECPVNLVAVARLERLWTILAGRPFARVSMVIDRDQDPVPCLVSAEWGAEPDPRVDTDVAESCLVLGAAYGVASTMEDALLQVLFDLEPDEDPDDDEPVAARLAERPPLLAALRRARRARRMTCADVAEILGCTAEQVARFEDDPDPHLSMLRRYALAVGATYSHKVTEVD